MTFAPDRRPLLGRQILKITLVLILGVTLGFFAAATRAYASAQQVSVVEDDHLLLGNPAAALRDVRQLGITVVRVSVRWASLAPGANSFRQPRHFNATAPAAYRAAGWAPLDTLVRTAAEDGIRVDLDVQGPAPLWATGRGMPHQAGYPFHNWRPSAVAYGKFLRAVATRYSGNYDPKMRTLAPGNPDDLPRVDLWSVYNEPNYGPSLAPQSAPGHVNLPESPRDYRGLVNQAWNGLRATGHGHDTILIGELAPRGNYRVGTFQMTAPLIFLRALYCLDSRYRPLRGRAATVVGCPATASGSRRFPGSNPGLFRVAGFSDHPYMSWFPPNREENQGVTQFRRMLPNFASLAVIGNLVRGIQRSLGAYRDHRSMPVWLTEFAYQTNPPTAHSRFPSPAVAAAYDNWAEYIAWRNPAIASFDQYLLQDPPKPRGRQGYNSGLIFRNGTEKPGYGAFRMPLYLPKTTASSSSQALEVWGGVRPAHYALLDLPGLSEAVTVLFASQGSTTFKPLAVVPISAANGYFDTRVKFPSSGTVQLQWTYPDDSLEGKAGLTAYSRKVSVTVR
jgi:hypothetical protein